jgi:predicted DNA-binding protein
VLKPFATKLPLETLAKLDQLSQRSRIPKSRLCEQAIELLIHHYQQIDSELSLAQKVREGERLERISAS